MSAYRSPISEGEFVLRFSNKVSLKCNGKFSDVTLTSRSYPTTTISDFPISRNRNADIEMLQILLKDFDTKFYIEVNKRIDECIETMEATEGSFFE
jgi:hypothetical protein